MRFTIAVKLCLKDRKDIVGNNDYALFPKQIADFYIGADKRVSNSGCIKQSLDVAICKPEHVIRFLTTKAPLLDDNNNYMGIFGISSYLSEEKFPATSNQIESIANIVKLSSYIQDSMPKRIVIKDIELSNRESFCIYYLTKGFSNKQIAQKLHISVRTIETFLDNIKNKLGYKYRTELVEYLFNNNNYIIS